MDSHSSQIAGRVIARDKIVSHVWAWAVLLTGLFLFAMSIVLMVKADLGLGPWDIFHVGLSQASGFTLGQVAIVAGLVVLILAYVIGRQRPGPGTIANMLLIGIFIDWTYGYVPTMTYYPFKFVMFLGGMVLMGVASAIYIGAGLGAGPRDSLMLAVHRVTGMSIRLTRTVIEAVCLCHRFSPGRYVRAGYRPVCDWYRSGGPILSQFVQGQKPALIFRRILSRLG